MKFPYTTRILGTLLMIFSLAQFVPGFLAYFLNEKDLIYNFISTGFITFLVGSFLFFLASEKNGDLIKIMGPCDVRGGFSTTFCLKPPVSPDGKINTPKKATDWSKNVKKTYKTLFKICLGHFWSQIL